MKKFIFSIIAVLALSSSVFAQDARNRTVNTIVGDVLAQLPCDNAAALTAQMEDLAKSAPASVEAIAAMFQPVEKMTNNKFEYAISGLVRYVNTPGNEKFKDAVAKGLQNAIAKTSDKVAKSFFESELYLLGSFEPKQAAKPSVAELLAQAKTLSKSAKTNERIQSLWLYDEALGAANASKVISAMKDSSRPYRWSALETAKSYADNAFYKKLTKAFNGASTDAKNDILYWLGEQKADSQIDFILKQIGGKNSVEAITAAGKIGGEKACQALVNQLGGANNDVAVAALERFNGNISETVLEALKTASGDKLNALMGLASKRHVTGAASQIIDLAKSGNDAARKALAGVSATRNAKAIAEMLTNASGSNAADYSKALSSSLKSLAPGEQFNSLTDIALASGSPEKFIEPIAATNTDEAVALLAGASLAGYDDATKALATMDNAKVAPYMLAAGQQNEAYLAKYVELTNKYDSDVNSKAGKFIKVLAAAKSNSMKNKAISTLASAPTVEAFEAVVPYLNDKNTAYAAANAVNGMISKVAAFIPYEKVEAPANKAIEILKATGDPDDGYAVDNIKKAVSENKPFPKSELTAEEKEAGFVMLYDGTNLDNWIGDKTGYQSFNGAINVTANYGGTGNLYTKDEYRNFVYRFEFRFLVPAANNGVGVRGPATGVDAAYESMCEVQILDHDDPVYSWLQPYQVHGSVYGVIPAKRIVHKPIGEWEWEEIKVVGDHITVTVNGEVVVDGNIREACQGHNVDPDGSNTNPYTRDHRNHPGMFNERGHISFCGHGRGLQFRNVRVLALPDEK